MMKAFILSPQAPNAVCKVLYGETPDGRYVELREVYEFAMFELDFDTEDTQARDMLENASCVSDLRFFSDRVEVLEYSNLVRLDYTLDGVTSDAVDFDIQGKYWEINSAMSIEERS